MRPWPALVLFVACSDPTIVTAKHFADECATSSDCVAVIAGDQCQPCACPNDAIASSQVVLFEADRSSARAACPFVERVACSPCAPVSPGCVSRASPTSDGPRFCSLR